MTVLFAALPFTGVYPYFIMQALCFALFACAFNLLIGYGGLLSFGHAMFLGTAGYVTGAHDQGMGFPAGTRHSRRRACGCGARRRQPGSSRSAARASTSR